jgi:hypothetical protein
MADSAATAGGHAVYYKHPVTDAVNKDLRLNNRVTLASAALIENAPKAGLYHGNMKAVRVSLSTTPALPFVSYFISGATTISAEATSLVSPDSAYCMLALDQTTTAPGIDISGGGTTDFNCGFHSNAGGTNAFTIRGSNTNVLASSVSAVGMISGSVPSTTLRQQNQPLVADPFASLPPASSYASNCKPAVSVGGSQTVTLTEGCYNGGMSLAGNVTLSPGVYVMNAGDFSVSGNGVKIQGTGVTIILTGSAPSSIGKVSIAGGAEVNLAAPQSGALSGVLFYQDSRTPSLANTSSIAGNSVSKLEGNMYFPKTTVSITGTSGMNMDCFKVVSFRMTLTGTSTSRNKCPDIPTYNGFGEKVRLVA